MEYRKPQSIFSITRGIGTPFSLDDSTMNKSRGFFAIVMIDIDMLSTLPIQILVEKFGVSFISYIEF